VVVTAQDGVTTKAYSIAVTRAASSNADLSNLTISNGTLTPAFASGTLSYSAGVASNNNVITVTPTAADATATVKVNGASVASGSPSGPISLSLGNNPITVLVTAQDGVTTQTYTVNVNYLLPSSCTYSLSPLDLSNVAPAGGSADITVTTPNGCPVPTATYQPWVNVVNTVTNGNSTTIELQISSNVGSPPRATTIQVADRLFLIIQLGP